MSSIERFVDSYQLVLAMLLPCSTEVFVSAQAQELAPRCQHAYRAPTGLLLLPKHTRFSETSPRFLIWIGSDQEKTFGPTITGLIRKHIEPERMILWDSKQRGGRPNTMQLLKDTYKSWNAEVIFITSNMQGNNEMMEGCREGMRLANLVVRLVNLLQPACMPSAHSGTSDSASFSWKYVAI